MRAAALHSRPSSLLDHIGVLAAVLDIPLLISDEETAQLANVFYPQVRVILQEPTLDYLAANFDILFVSSKLWAIELYHTFPLVCGKKMRIVYCPHGNSDKGYTLTEEHHNPEDISLLYGDHMVDLLKDTGMFDKIQHVIPTGNYRHAFFLEHRAFYEQLVQEKVPLDKTKKTILYAPTWHSTETPSSFFAECTRLIDQLPSHFNLLIKLHPYLYEQKPAQTTHLLEKQHPNVLFLDEFPPVYPLLTLSDIYLGDFSSVGYDFLVMDKPMYFFNPGGVRDRGRFLHRCGMEVPEGNVFEFIEKTLENNRVEFAEKRRETCLYTFGKPRKLSEIGKNIVENIFSLK